MRPLKSRKRHCAAGTNLGIDGGGVLVEVSFVIAASFVLIALVADLGRLLYTYDRMISAVRIGVRVASVTPPPAEDEPLPADDPRIVSVVAAMLSGTGAQVHSSAPVVPSLITNADDQTCSNVVTVSAVIPFRGLFTRLLRSDAFNLSYQLSMRYNAQPLCY